MKSAASSDCHRNQLRSTAYLAKLWLRLSVSALDGIDPSFLPPSSTLLRPPLPASLLSTPRLPSRNTIPPFFFFREGLQLTLGLFRLGRGALEPNFVPRDATRVPASMLPWQQVSCASPCGVAERGEPSSSRFQILNRSCPLSHSTRFALRDSVAVSRLFLALSMYDRLSSAPPSRGKIYASSLARTVILPILSSKTFWNWATLHDADVDTSPGVAERQLGLVTRALREDVPHRSALSTGLTPAGRLTRCAWATGRRRLRPCILSEQTSQTDVHVRG